MPIYRLNKPNGGMGQVCNRNKQRKLGDGLMIYGNGLIYGNGTMNSGLKRHGLVKKVVFGRKKSISEYRLTLCSICSQ